MSRQFDNYVAKLARLDAEGKVRKEALDDDRN
jgi:hypothetical protein